MRRDEPDTGIEARDEIGPDVGNRQATGFRKLLFASSRQTLEDRGILRLHPRFSPGQSVTQGAGDDLLSALILHPFLN